MNSREMISVIEADGWYLVRCKGSHHHFKHPDKPGLVTIPHPKKDLLPATRPASCARRGSSTPADEEAESHVVSHRHPSR